MLAEDRLPGSVQELSAAWIQRVFHERGVINAEDTIREIELEDPGKEASYAGSLARVRITYARPIPDAPETIIAKFPASERLMRRVLAPVYRSEIRFYQHLAAQSALPAPRCYAAMEQRGNSVLLLEDLAGVATLGDQELGCSDEAAFQVIEGAARLHACWWNGRGLEAQRWLSNYGVHRKKNWLIYAGSLLPYEVRVGRITPPATGHLMRTLWRYRSILHTYLEHQPVALHHGDLRLANLAFTESDVIAFDWQTVRIGLPYFDVAWFFWTSLDVTQRRRIESELLGAYHRALVGAGITDQTLEQVWLGVRLGMILCVPQIMVIGAFLRMDPERREFIRTMLERFEAAVEEYRVQALLDSSAPGAD